MNSTERYMQDMRNALAKEITEQAILVDQAPFIIPARSVTKEEFKLMFPKERVETSNYSYIGTGENGVIQLKECSDE